MTSPRQTPRYEVKRDLILAAAARLLNAQGVRGTTLTDVAESVGLNTTSVTYYFRRKEDLAEAAFLQTITAIRNLIDRADARAGTPSRDPKAWLQAYMQLYFSELAAIETGELPEFTNFSDVRTLTGPHRVTVFKAYVDMFRQVRRLFDGMTLSRDARNARTHLLISILLWAPTWIRRYDPADYGDGASRVCDLMLSGLDPARSAWPSYTANDGGLVDTRDESAFLGAATAIINEQGYSGATITRIAARLSVTKGAFYYRNIGKDELVAACHERTLVTVRRIQDRARLAHDLAWARLTTACIDLVGLEVERPGSLLRTTALAALPPASRRDMMIRTDRLSKRYGALVAEGVIDGSMRPVDSAIAGRLVESMINAAVELHDWVPGSTAETASILYVQPLFRGLLSTVDDPVQSAD